MKRLKVGILGATGMVGQRFITLLVDHPWFGIVSLAASPTSSGKTYKEAVKGRWKMERGIPERIRNMIVLAVKEDINEVSQKVDFVFSALDMDKEEIRKVEVEYASRNVGVVSNNSAHRWTPDVPMIIPEVNAQHVKIIDTQRENRGFVKGCIVVKPNCSIQSYVPILTALDKFRPLKISITSIQAISGAGRTFQTWPEMIDNVVPFIKGEEEKSEKEPLKIWGMVKNGKIEMAESPKISATCIRIPVTDGHMVSVSVKFERKPAREEILEAIENYQNPLHGLDLPSAPSQLIRYFEKEDRPQTKIDRDFEKGMGIAMGRLREDSLFDWKFVALSHNTIRGAAGGAILLAELLRVKKYI